MLGKTHTAEEALEVWNTRPIEDALRAELEAWKADAERLADVLRTYRSNDTTPALEAHHALVEKEKK